ncbi:lipoprotein insertase outer membrane protein LolB [Motiliproteus sp. SC1-56]|uniref:lipoprotein insertase outer membrane protein LolB n=1 Tax=Motiliproteus sp. SC1-56 TaxID=2799565 RepID=UPI001A902DE5|nr:lipoprotein insertase outer membrane protein LolB [Motiliproteus sp. SC1-56]
MLTRLIAALAVLVLAGCATAPLPDSQAPGWAARQLQLQALESWQVLGKMGVRQPDRYTSASLNWTQQPRRYQIFLAGPLGQGSVRIQGTPGLVTLDIAGEGRFQAATPEQMLQAQLGWHLPISQLHYWVRGLPAPDYPSRHTLDPQNRLERLEQQGWVIQYREYQDGPPPQLPRRLILSHGDSLRVVLLLKEWTLPPPPHS